MNHIDSTPEIVVRQIAECEYEGRMVLRYGEYPGTLLEPGEARRQVECVVVARGDTRDDAVEGLRREVHIWGVGVHMRQMPVTPGGWAHLRPSMGAEVDRVMQEYDRAFDGLI
ncbi:MAG TPA: hypothetical protein VIT91_12515 [Chthoniobacterales bacterium]